MARAVRISLALFAFVCTIGFAIAAWEATAPIVLMVAGHSYRTSGASQATLGSIGVKVRKGLIERIPRLRDNSAYSRVEEDPGWTTLRFKVEANEDQQIERSTLSDLAAGNAVLATAQKKSEGRHFTSARYVVLRIASTLRLEKELRKSTPESPLGEILERALGDPDLRIVTAVVVAYDYESNSDVKGVFQPELNKGLLEGGTLDLTLQDRTGTHRTMKDGVIVGYEYSRFSWVGRELKAIRVDGEGDEGDRKCPVGAVRNGVLAVAVSQRAPSSARASTARLAAWVPGRVAVQMSA